MSTAQQRGCIRSFAATRWLLSLLNTVIGAGGALTCQQHRRMQLVSCGALIHLRGSGIGSGYGCGHGHGDCRGTFLVSSQSRFQTGWIWFFLHKVVLNNTVVANKHTMLPLMEEVKATNNNADDDDDDDDEDGNDDDEEGDEGRPVGRLAWELPLNTSSQYDRLVMSTDNLQRVHTHA